MPVGWQWLAMVGDLVVGLNPRPSPSFANARHGRVAPSAMDRGALPPSALITTLTIALVCSFFFFSLSALATRSLDRPATRLVEGANLCSAGQSSMWPSTGTFGSVGCSALLLLCYYR